jgi:hypothetical protein
LNRKKIMSTDTKETKPSQTEELPGPGEPGYYSPPVVPSVTVPQNAPAGPHTAAIAGPRPPEETGQPQPTEEEIEARRKGGAPFDRTVTGAQIPPAKKAASDGSQEDYDDMTVAELKDLAHKRGIEVHSDMLKDDIIKALKKSDKK